MASAINKIPQHIREHIRRITATSGLPDNDDSVDRIAEAWIEKREAFETKLAELHMEEWDEYARDEEHGALIMTYSGSLLTVGPLVDETRNADYLSIGLRQDVPPSASDSDSRFAEDIRIDAPVVFESGPVHKTSPVFKIAVLTEQLDPEEEQEQLHEATLVLSRAFVEVNKTIVAE